MTIAIQPSAQRVGFKDTNEAASDPALDVFAEDRDGSLEYPSYMIESAGVVAEGSRIQLEEERLCEFLLFGSGGQAFAGNPNASVGAEDRGWHSSSMRGVFSDHYHRERLADYLWWLYQVGDPVARNIVNTYTFFIVGSGSDVSFTGENSKRNEKSARRWKTLRRKVKWRKKERQIVKGVALFGEAFALTFPRKGPIWKVEAGKRTTKLPRGRQTESPELRILNSRDIESIVFRPGDPDNVLAYAQRTVRGELRGNDPRDTVHFTFDTLPNSVRGHPILLPVLQQLFYYRAWLTNRHWLNMVRTRVPLIMRRKTGGAAAIKATKGKYSKLPPPGTVWFLPGMLEAEFPNHNVGAADAKDDGKQILRTIAMGVQLPEFLVTADASNANYSSSVVAESPAMRMFEDLQNVIEDELAVVIARLLSIPEEDVVVKFPPVQRNIRDRVAALHQMYLDEVLSARSYAEGMNLAWEGPDGERVRLEAEGVVIGPLGRSGGRPGSDEEGDIGGPENGRGGAEPGRGRSTPPGGAAGAAA